MKGPTLARFAAIALRNAYAGVFAGISYHWNSWTWL